MILVLRVFAALGAGVRWYCAFYVAAPHRARAALAAVRAPAAAALRLPRPRADREPDGAGQPRPPPDQPARRVRAGLRRELRDGRRRSSRCCSRSTSSSRCCRSSASRCSRSARCGSRSCSIRSPTRLQERLAEVSDGGRGGRGRHPGGQGVRCRAGGEGVGSTTRAEQVRARGRRAREAALHLQPAARPAARWSRSSPCCTSAARTRSTDRSPSATWSRSARSCCSSCSRCA